MFGRSAKKLTDEIAKLNKSVSIQVNGVVDKKPGKGNFIVSINGSEVVALKGRPRPFTALRETDLAELAKKVVDKINIIAE